MKLRTVLFFLTVLAFTAFSQQQLKDFNSLTTALKSGEQVRAVFKYGACKLVVDSTEDKSPDVTGGLTVQSWEYFPANTVHNPKGFLSFSSTVLITHPKRGCVWNYVKCKVYEDGKVEINARYLNVTSYETVMNETFYGAINNGTDNEGVYFYSAK